MKIMAGLFATVALIFGYIISYNVVQRVAPEYMTLWWIALILTFVGMVFSVADDLR